ncbi:hypothetical protein EJ05DRAFT_477377 [Pseudovirgaria hyperparasitica]|uniref:N-acetyltransferase domain-containing protein n=1 Tax=Pseudovirgaria hyperparasitica TaxID=470096 RepID=A0A6A6W4Q7_9PEZI|nr:uncharacterized protein EJ05DRAFT_477377 [Pseudovirgaria hyperparasitica]KAF2757159.1 hypothetical protein EJ05DRAFT_477377 [Pseudovirgaria hyperparasitica]
MTTITIEEGGKEFAGPAGRTLSKCFNDDPVIRFIVHTLPEPRRLAYLPKLFDTFAHAGAINGATFYSANSWQSAVILMPPGSSLDGPLTVIRAGFLSVLWHAGLDGAKRMLWEYTPILDAVKARALGKEDYFYVFFVGTLEEHRGKGLAAAQMRRVQTVAREAGKPVWLEATTKKSCMLYRKLGWQVTEEVILGKNVVDTQGFQKDGGEGVKIWGMLWKPKK